MMGRMYSESFDIDESHHNSYPCRGVERREDTDSSEAEVSVQGAVVSSSQGTKLFYLITKQNWPDAVKRCRGEGSMEAMTWIVEKNEDGSIRWKLLPIHKVSISL